MSFSFQNKLFNFPFDEICRDGSLILKDNKWLNMWVGVDNVFYISLLSAHQSQHF